MIKHIVLFSFKEQMAVADKMTELKEIRQGLLDLQGKVETLRSIECGINCNPNEKFDLALTCTFDDMEGLAYYATHPLHVAVGKRIRQNLEARACTDYEI